MKIFSQNEINRILFLINRDGIDNAVLFAKQTIVQYRIGVLKTRKRYPNNWSHLSLPEYKRHANMGIWIHPHTNESHPVIIDYGIHKGMFTSNT